MKQRPTEEARIQTKSPALGDGGAQADNAGKVHVEAQRPSGIETMAKEIAITNQATRKATRKNGTAKINHANKAEEDYKTRHRRRMRNKIMGPTVTSASDNEILEMLLYLIYPRRDVKPTVHKIIKRYQGLNGFISASTNESSLNELVKEFGESTAFLAKLIMLALKNSLIAGIREDTVLGKWSELCSYLKINFGHLQIEQFSVLYMDHAFRLIDICQFGIGTVDESVVYVREIIKTGLAKNAKNIVLCHNHLSGKVEPSQADIETTQQVIIAGKVVNIEVLDHIIVSGDNLFSFRSANLI